MKVKAADIRAAMRQPSPDIICYLLYGPDESTSAEFAAGLAKAFGDDAERVDFTGAELKSDPSKLADEAASLSLFGEKRYIRVTTQGEESLAAVENLLAADNVINPVIIQATGMTDRGKVAKAVAAAKNALACMNYLPDANEMAGIVSEFGRTKGVNIPRPLAAQIASYTGMDRRLAEQEVEKMSLYLDASPNAPQVVEPEIALALRAETEDEAMGPVINCVLGGNVGKLADELARIDEAGISEVGLVLALQRRAVQLAQLAGKMGRGGDIHAFVENESRRGPIFWKEKPDYVRQLSRWRGPALARLSERLIDLHGRMMMNSQSGSQLLRQELTEITRAAAAMAR